MLYSHLSYQFVLKSRHFLIERFINEYSIHSRGLGLLQCSRKLVFFCFFVGLTGLAVVSFDHESDFATNIQILVQVGP